MDTQASSDSSLWEIFLVFLRLGCTSFGGPIAHLGYFRAEFVTHRRWLTEQSYADVVALAQFLPGPTSSQVGLAVGLSRGGVLGCFAAWVGFTLPSALAMMLFGLSITIWGNAISSTALHALKIVAVAVVAQAVWGMAKTLCIGTARKAIMAIAACSLLIYPNPWGQVLVIILSAIAGMVLFRADARRSHDRLQVPVSKLTGGVLLGLFLMLLIALPIAAHSSSNESLAVFSSFYQAGSLVFGGGHVILPLLQTAVVPTGWVENDIFLAGYGAAQALPGPLFTFAAFLGTVMSVVPNGMTGAGMCLFAVFVPSFLLILGTLPFWEEIRRNRKAQSALGGVNAGVVGLLLAALYDPVWTNAIYTPIDLGWTLLAFFCLHSLKAPPWLVVLMATLIGLVSGMLF
ncbi:chromate efflux transporter [uncultured Oxalicibacterium sp.]|uniref:chromate efflux transporter n=1 Tax=uncultured Oxalicibacterium sp. TaxID=1168540 RepID=UPI0025D06D1E|nr:chromate efflux transporter [uncultured Oxalicibacterium sp.]